MIRSPDNFGCLLSPVNITFQGGWIRPRDDFEDIAKALKGAMNRDGYLYPPVSCMVTQKLGRTNERTVPKTKRPAKLFRIPATHLFNLETTAEQESDRLGLGGFIVQSLAFLHGKKLQFWDWWVEGRIPITARNVDFHIHQSGLQIFFGRAIPFWIDLTEINRHRLTNLLFVHNIAGAVEWPWQRLQLEYMVTDACYAITKDVRKWGYVKHKERLNLLCKEFGLVQNKDWFEIILRLRNDLFHEALWDGVSPFSFRSNVSFYAPSHLRKFNNRLITSIICGRGEYSSSVWTTLGTFAYSLD